MENDNERKRAWEITHVSTKKQKRSKLDDISTCESSTYGGRLVANYDPVVPWAIEPSTARVTDEIWYIGTAVDCGRTGATKLHS